MTAVEVVLAILLCAALFTLATEWVRANGEQDRADRAEDFADECLAMLVEERAR